MGMNIMRMKGRAKMMRTIKVTGKGKIAVKPDKIRLYVNKEGLCRKNVVKSRKSSAKVNVTPCTARERIPSLPGCRPI